jgi:pyruvate,water dikinase
LKNNAYIVPLSSKLLKESVGNKAVSLLFLKKHGYRIPVSFVVLGKAFTEYLTDKEKVLGTIKNELEKLPDYSFAVRSSTNFEDASDFSHAGQFESLLNVRGTLALFDAVKNVWESALPKKGDHYFEKTGNKKPVCCSVVIQEMVDSKLAGVSFSKNPVNNLHETIIEAVQGSGENLVQKGETPLRWTFKKGKLASGISDYSEISLIEQVAKATSALKKKFKNDVDIEWAYDGKSLYFLQIRSVTANTHVSIYSNKMAKEMLPGQVKPLVWSLNIPLVNGTWIEILEKVIGKCRMKPEDLARSFYYRTYFNVSNLALIFAEFGVPFESIEEMMLDEKKTKHTFKPGLKTIKHTFRLMKFMVGILRFEKVFLKEYPILKERITELKIMIQKSKRMDEEFEYLYEELFTTARKLTYFNIITPLLMRVYSKRFGNKLKKRNIHFEEIDFVTDFRELKKYSPVSKMAEIKNRYDQFPENIKSSISGFEQISTQKETQPVYDLFRQFLTEFGHHSESGNDISHPKWEEDPELVFKMIVDFVDKKNQTPVQPDGRADRR